MLAFRCVAAQCRTPWGMSPFWDPAYTCAGRRYHPTSNCGASVCPRSGRKRCLPSLPYTRAFDELLDVFANIVSSSLAVSPPNSGQPASRRPCLWGEKNLTTAVACSGNAVVGAGPQVPARLSPPFPHLKEQVQGGVSTEKEGVNAHKIWGMKSTVVSPNLQ